MKLHVSVERVSCTWVSFVSLLSCPNKRQMTTKFVYLILSLLKGTTETNNSEQHYQKMAYILVYHGGFKCSNRNTRNFGGKRAKISAKATKTNCFKSITITK